MSDRQDERFFRDDARRRIEAFVFERFPLAAASDGASLLTRGIVDSLGMVDIICFLEEAMNIDIDDEDLTPENFDSLANIAALVHSKKVRES